MALSGPRPIWLTFDCYGTLIQWDEGLLAAVERVLSRKGAKVDASRFIAVYDRHEHDLEQSRPHRTFREVTAISLERTMAELVLPHDATDSDLLTESISRMPPFPEVVATLGQLSAAGFKLAIISNTDDAIIAGNVGQLSGHMNKVITAQQAQAYKPSAQIFEHAWATIGARKDQIVHICASPHLDLAAAQAMNFRAVWIDRGTGRQPPQGYAPDATGPRLDAVPKLFAAAGWL